MGHREAGNGEQQAFKASGNHDQAEYKEQMICAHKNMFDTRHCVLFSYISCR